MNAPHSRAEDYFRSPQEPATITEVANPALDFLIRACALFYQATQSVTKENPMRCPHCSHDIAELWQPMHTITDRYGKPIARPSEDLAEHIEEAVRFRLHWMFCHNEECQRLIIRVTRTRWQKEQGPSYESVDEYWFAVPRRPTPKPIHPLVLETEYSTIYRQASLILDDSPMASAALSRRVLADLLHDYGKYTQHGLSVRVNAFIADKKNPRHLRENLHHFREMANFSVHTQKDETAGTIIKVDHEEAEWMLDVLDRLFEFYIVEKAHSARMRAAFDEKIKKAGRDPIPPLPLDEKSKP